MSYRHACLFYPARVSILIRRPPCVNPLKKAEITTQYKGQFTPAMTRFYKQISPPEAPYKTDKNLTPYSVIKHLKKDLKTSRVPSASPILPLPQPTVNPNLLSGEIHTKYRNY